MVAAAFEAGVCSKKLLGTVVCCSLLIGWLTRLQVSDGPDGLTLQEYGQVILSKLPFRCSIVQFSRMKMCVVAELALGAVSLTTLGIAAVHLSSNYFDGATNDGASGVAGGSFQDKREKQLDVVTRRLELSDLRVRLVFHGLKFSPLFLISLGRYWLETLITIPNATIAPIQLALATRTQSCAASPLTLCRIRLRSSHREIGKDASSSFYAQMSKMQSLRQAASVRPSAVCGRSACAACARLLHLWHFCMC